MEKLIKKLDDKVSKISIKDMPGGVSMASNIAEQLKSDSFQAYVKNGARGQSPVYQMKDITWGASGAAGTNDVTQNYMPFTIPQYPFEEPIDMRSIVPVGSSETASLDYPQELLYTDSMAMETEQNASTASDITFQMVTETSHRIATHADVSRRALRNTAWLSQYLANRFMEKYVKLLNTQVLVGDGTGENLNGIVTQATAYAAAGDYTDTIPSGESSLYDCIIAMKSQLYNVANVTANALFVSPVTFYQLTVQKNTTRAYAYD